MFAWMGIADACWSSWVLANIPQFPVSEKHKTFEAKF